MFIYDLTFIIKPELKESEILPIIEKIKNWLKQYKGQITNKKTELNRKLAYPIKKYQTGHYVILDIEAPKEKINDLDRLLKMEENILRHLITKKSEIKEQKTTVEQKPKISKKKKKQIKKTAKVEKEKTKKEKTKKETSQEKIKLDELDKKLEEILKGEI